jgi:predicted O-methyltransferase YrrM
MKVTAMPRVQDLTLRTLARERVDASRLASASQVAEIRLDDVPPGEWEDVGERVASLGFGENPEAVNPGDRRALYYLARKVGARRILEVGTHLGVSTVHLALALAQELGGDASLTTVDVRDVNDPVARPWEDFESPISPSEAVERAGVSSLVRFVRASSLDFLRENEDRYDLIFLDGDHLAKTVYQEVPAALERLRSPGFVVLHDYFPDLRPLWPDGEVIPGPWMAIERLRRQGANLRAEPLGELPWPTKQGTRVTSLALLSRAGGSA